jgi:pSer/pThr/pTyr-binding forkhead associated (FHA) protein
MKLSLVVLNPGRMEGKSIPIMQSQFVIGRDPQCHLRPTSPLISKRHCAVLVKGGRIFVRDFESTNGTLVNDQPIARECELHDQDRLKVGPLEFRLEIEQSVPGSYPTPLPAQSGSPTPADDVAAAMLLSVSDEPDSVPPVSQIDSEGIPAGSTIVEPLPGLLPSTDKPPEDKAEAVKRATGNTSSAAKAILEKYLRRDRK